MMRLTQQQHTMDCPYFFIQTPGVRSHPFATIWGVREQVMIRAFAGTLITWPESNANRYSWKAFKKIDPFLDTYKHTGTSFSEFANDLNIDQFAMQKGAECYRFNKDFPDREPWHNTILPFTRNVVGPMGYTPVAFSDVLYPHLTTFAYELALSVVCESGWVHFPNSLRCSHTFSKAVIYCSLSSGISLVKKASEIPLLSNSLAPGK